MPPATARVNPLLPTGHGVPQVLVFDHVTERVPDKPVAIRQLVLWILDAKSEDLAASRTLRIYRQNIESDRTPWKTVVGRHSGRDPARTSLASIR